MSLNVHIGRPADNHKYATISDSIRLPEHVLLRSNSSRRALICAFLQPSHTEMI